MQLKGIFDWIKIKWIFGGFSVTFGLWNFHREIFMGERGDEVKLAILLDNLFVKLCE